MKKLTDEGDNMLNKILLYTHGGSQNHGCEAIVRSTLQVLKNYKEFNITLSTKSKKEDEQYGLDKINGLIIVEEDKQKKFSFRNIIRKCNQILGTGNDDAIFLKFRSNVNTVLANKIAMSIGGDNYCYNGYEKSLSMYNCFFNNRNIKTVLWGCSIEPCLLERKEIIEDMKRYSLITTRESITYEALMAAGISTNTKLYPDPAFTLPKVEINLPEDFLEGKIIGINVSPLVQSLDKGNDITYKNYNYLIKYIISNTENNVALIPHVVWNENNDLEPLTQLFKEFKDTGRVLLIQDYNCMELKGFISRCRMFIGARTHATIAAYSTCVPTLVVGYSVKAKGIAKDIFGSYENYVFPVQSLKNEDDLTKAFIWLCEHEHKIRKHLNNLMPEYIEKAWLAGAEVIKLL